MVSGVLVLVYATGAFFLVRYIGMETRSTRRLCLCMWTVVAAYLARRAYERDTKRT